MTTSVERKKAKGGDGLTEAERATLNAEMAKLEEKILHAREEDDERILAHQELWKDRWRCKVIGVGRKGEKTVELGVGAPTHPDKAYRLNIKLGEWIEEGLPMFVIQRLQNAYDSDADFDPKYADGKESGFYHKPYRAPRFSVIIDKKVEAK